MPIKYKKLPNKKTLNKYFDYDENTGLVTRKLSFPNAKKGTIAGTAQNHGYVVVSIKKNTYMLHRVIWVMKKGAIPRGMVIDHINGDKQDNRWDNLRLVSEIENNRNQKRSRKNNSGTTGVYYKKDRDSWYAEIEIKGKKKYLGQYKKKENAICARKKAELIYKFYPNHDREKIVFDYDKTKYFKSIVEVLKNEDLLEEFKKYIYEK